MKVKVESEKVGLKLNIQKTKIMASGPNTSWEIDGETVSDFIFLGSKITADDDCSHEIKRHPCRGYALGLCTLLLAYMQEGACVHTHLWSHNFQTYPGVPGCLCIPCARIYVCVHVCDCMSDKLPGAETLQEGSDGSLRHFSCVRKTRLPFQEAFPSKIN